MRAGWGGWGVCRVKTSRTGRRRVQYLSVDGQRLGLGLWVSDEAQAWASAKLDDAMREVDSRRTLRMVADGARVVLARFTG